MKKIINTNFLAWLITLFILVQTSCELYFFYGENTISILGFAIPTIIRLGFVLLIGVVFLLTTKFSKKHLFFIGYLILVITYFVIHHFNALNFNSLVPNNFNYSLLKELFYIIRVLIPYFLFMVCLDIKFSKRQIQTIIYGLFIILTCSLLISNLFVIGTGSYSKERILGNIFTWFTNGYEKYSYYGLATKGFFHDPNRLSALMVLLTGILLSYYYFNKSKVTFCMLLMQMIASCMIGTKVATFGFIILMILFVLVYLFNVIILKKEKIFWFYFGSLLLIIFLDILIIPYSPCKDRTINDRVQYSNSHKETSIEKGNELIEELDSVIANNDDQLLIEYLQDNRKKFGMNEGFTMYYYPIKYDPYFWTKIYKSDFESRYNYRFIEKSMLERIKEINNNKYDNLLGISYTRESNVFELEKDFAAQYYSMGILGVIILFGPYLGIITYFIIKILLKLKKRYEVINVILVATLSLYLFSAYFSGNVLDAFVTSINFSILLSFVFRNIKDGKYES